MFEKKHEMLRKLAREFAEKELEPIADEAEKNIYLAELQFHRNTAEQAEITSPLQLW